MADPHSIQWRPVSGYEGRYEVSSNGMLRKVSGEHVGQWLSDQGYAVARLSGPRRMVRVHRLVATAFVPNVNSHPCVNHKDCNRSNNHAGNLEWCSQAQNLAHSARLGRMQFNYWTGKRSPNAKLSDETVNEIRTVHLSCGLSWSQLADRFGVSKRTVGKIIRGESYV